jgi:hypothetical protein
MADSKLKVIQPEEPIEQEILAEAIVRISDAFTKLQKSGLNKKAIMILIKAETGMSQRDILLVLDTLPRLKDLYCR